MPKKLFLSITLLLYSTFFLGQSKQPDIAFDSDYFNAVDHWVVLPKKPTETSYLLGYIYLDAASGFTFVFDSFLTIGSEDSWSSFSTLKNFIFKTILNKNAPLVAIIADDKIKELQLLEKPQWLKRYDSDNTPDVLVGKGSQYNAIGKSDLALPFLENAYRQNPKTKNVAFELALAYNATHQFQKAIAVLNAALQNETDYKLYRELGFALVQIQKFNDAEKVYELGIESCPETSQKREMAIDMAQTFYRLQDTDKFEKWKAILKNFIK